ncbi:MAG TPA: RpiB/LacA/LacB family sugar-phosphate isomerase [Candidatus Paceibacterota bacterium]|nr:RpiB/LacA/LacB family sugar-phosphate isomerase [Candidatus Paceibacterota bacterium]
MKIFIASDHAGFKLKDVLIPFLKQEGHEVVDMGAFVYKMGDDYPDFIKLAAEKVSEDPENTRGIILGASGQGEAIVANKFPGVRAVVYYGGNREIIKLSRNHNDANILSLGARFLNEKEAKEMVRLWLGAKFLVDEERHPRRIEKIKEIESVTMKSQKTIFRRLLHKVTRKK